MASKTILWQNKTWAIHSCQYVCPSCPKTPYLMLEKKTTGQCDYPVQHDGRVLYDFPERVPAYIRKKVEKQFPIA